MNVETLPAPVSQVDTVQVTGSVNNLPPALAKIADQESGRYALGGIELSPARHEGRLVATATDTKMLCAVLVDGTIPDADAPNPILPAKMIPAKRKRGESLKSADVQFHHVPRKEEEKHLSQWVGQSRHNVDGDCVSGRFPAWRSLGNIIPENGWKVSGDHVERVETVRLTDQFGYDLPKPELRYASISICPRKLAALLAVFRECEDSEREVHPVRILVPLENSAPMILCDQQRVYACLMPFSESRVDKLSAVNLVLQQFGFDIPLEVESVENPADVSFAG